MGSWVSVGKRWLCLPRVADEDELRAAELLSTALLLALAGTLLGASAVLAQPKLGTAYVGMHAASMSPGSAAFCARRQPGWLWFVTGCSLRSTTVSARSPATSATS